MYTKITNPYTGNLHNIDSSKGRQIIQAYVSYLTGGANTKLQKQVKDRRRKVVRGRNKYQHGGGGKAKLVPTKVDDPRPVVRSKSAGDNVTVGDWSKRYSPPLPSHPVPLRRRRSAGDVDDVELENYLAGIRTSTGPITEIEKDEGTQIAQKLVRRHILHFTEMIPDFERSIVSDERGMFINLQERQLADEERTLEILASRRTAELPGTWAWAALEGIDDFYSALEERDTTPWSPEGQRLVRFLLILPRAGGRIVGTGYETGRDAAAHGARVVSDGIRAAPRRAIDGLKIAAPVIRDAVVAGSRWAWGAMRQGISRVGQEYQEWMERRARRESEEQVRLANIKANASHIKANAPHIKANASHIKANAPHIKANASPSACPITRPHFCPTQSSGVANGQCITEEHAALGACNWKLSRFNLTSGTRPYRKNCKEGGKGDVCSK